MKRNYPLTKEGSTFAPPPRKIHVAGRRIHFRHMQGLLWLGIGGFSAVLVASGIYFGVTQNVLKPAWDGLFAQAWWPDDRHLIRGLIEGIIAVPMIKWVASNWRKHWDETSIGDLELTSRLLGFLIVAGALMILAVWVVTFGWSMVAHHSIHVHYVSPTKRTAEIEAFAIGLAIGQATHWIWKPAARSIQLFFAEASVNTWNRVQAMPTWIRYPLTPPTFRQRVAWMHDNGIPCSARALWMRWALPAVGVAYLGLMGTGIYARWFA